MENLYTGNRSILSVDPDLNDAGKLARVMTRRDRGLDAQEYADRKAKQAAFNSMFPTRLPSHMGR